jgi:hypothetical protein
MRPPLFLCFVGCQLLAAIAYGQREGVVGVPVVDLGKGHQLIGKLHKPLGSVMRIQGVVVEGEFKGYEGGPNIRVQRIDGTATQEDIQIRLSNSTGAVKPDETTKVEPKVGETYEFQGYESGGFVGHPSGIWKSDDKEGELEFAWIQTTEHYFALRFHYVRGKPIAPVKYSPEDFIGRRALLEGVARDEDGKSIMEGDGWVVVVDAKAPWPKKTLGKKSRNLGNVQPWKTRLQESTSREALHVDRRDVAARQSGGPVGRKS